MRQILAALTCAAVASCGGKSGSSSSSGGTGGPAGGAGGATSGSGGAGGAVGRAGSGGGGAAGRAGAGGAAGAQSGTGGGAGDAAGTAGTGGAGGRAGEMGTGGTVGVGSGGAGGAFCGNGVVDPGEICDDGNAQTGDGCSPTCRRIAALSTGVYTSCVLIDDGSVKCWGYNPDGELGLGDTKTRGDNANEMGANLPAVDLGSGRTALAISTGTAASCALLDHGSVKCWGYNIAGSIGLGDTNMRGNAPGEMGDNLSAVDLGTGRTATMVGAGGDHVCAILDDGSIKCWGAGVFGGLGLGSTSAHGDTPGTMGDNLLAVDLGTGRNAKAIAVGGSHTCAILDNDSIKCWGDNGAGQLGLGDTNRRGDQPGEMGDALPAVDLGTGRTARSVSAGDKHTCAVLDNGAAKCWGLGFYGELGQGDTKNRGDVAGEMGDNLPAINLGTGRTAKTISAGHWQTCAVLDDQSVKCWGSNSEGELGVGDTTGSGDTPTDTPNHTSAVSLGTGRSAKAVVAKEYFTCALLDNDTVKCWGENRSGELGLGDVMIRGNQPGEMGDNLPTLQLP